MKRIKPILIADDDIDDQYLIKSAFQEVRLEEKLQFAINGKEVINYLENISDDAELPGLIVLDVNMPLMDGIETLKILKSSLRYRHIPVVMFSTSKNPADEKRSRDLGAVEFVSKPATYTEVKLAAKLLHCFSGITP